MATGRQNTESDEDSSIYKDWTKSNSEENDYIMPTPPIYLDLHADVPLPKAGISPPNEYVNIRPPQPHLLQTQPAPWFGNEYVNIKPAPPVPPRRPASSVERSNSDPYDEIPASLVQVSPRNRLVKQHSQSMEDVRPQPDRSHLQSPNSMAGAQPKSANNSPLPKLRNPVLRNLSQRHIEDNNYRLTFKETDKGESSDLYYKMDVSKVRYLYDFMPKALKELKVAMRSSIGCEILPSFRADEPGLDITNLTEDPATILGYLVMLDPQIKKIEKDITDPGLASFLVSENGKEELRKIEEEHQVVLDVEEIDQCLPEEDGKQGEMQEVDLDQAMPDSYKTKEGLWISLTTGNIIDEKTDVIVCSVEKYGNLKLGKVSQQIIEVGGQSIAKEFKQKINNIPTWDFVETKGGKLSNKIYFIVCPEYDGGKGVQKLRGLVTSCLARANTDNYKTICFPALGSGYLRFPPNVSASIILDEAVSFSATGPESLKMIKAVVLSSDTGNVEAFRSKLRAFKQQRRLTTFPSDVPIAKGITFPYSLATPSGLKFNISKGSIVDQNVDVLVNSTSINLDLRKGVVSSLILTKAGDIIQEECKRKKPGGLPNGEIVVTSGGNLPCRHIYHGAVPIWTDGKSQIMILRRVLRTCLETGDQAKMTSMAMPTIGTGTITRYPPSDVLQVIMEEILQFSEKHPNSTLNDITVVVYDDNILQEFVLFLENNLQQIWPTLSSRQSSFDSSQSYGCDIKLFATGIEQEDLNKSLKSLDDFYNTHRISCKLGHKELGDKLANLAEIQPNLITGVMKSCGVQMAVRVEMHQEFIHIEGYDKNVTAARTSLQKLLGEVNVRMSINDLLLTQQPSTWDKMRSEEKVKLVSLKQTSQEYQLVEKGILETVTSIKIIQIERVQNPALFMHYQVFKFNMASTGSTFQTEKILYHGTSHKVLTSINKSGFNRSHCKDNSGKHTYGKGVYFARGARYSINPLYAPRASNGNQYLYQCKVLTGYYTEGKKDMAVPPLMRPEQDPDVRFNTTVNDIKKPTVFVIYHDTQAYPEYLITFKTDKK